MNHYLSIWWYWCVLDDLVSIEDNVSVYSRYKWDRSIIYMEYFNECVLNIICNCAVKLFYYFKNIIIIKSNDLIKPSIFVTIYAVKLFYYFKNIIIIKSNTIINLSIFVTIYAVKLFYYFKNIIIIKSNGFINTLNNCYHLCS